LDPPGFDLVDEVIRELKRRGTTIMMATHQVERSRTYSDWEIVLEAGKVVRSAAVPAAAVAASRAATPGDGTPPGQPAGTPAVRLGEEVSTC
jgi:energy-coupling factor transporter ATP-binding protein EcfA2